MNEIPGLVEKLAALLINRNLTMTTVESCTGGGIGASFTAVSGSSNWYEYGFITYSNKAKVALVKVSQKTLNEYGAVSRQTVTEMAEGALIQASADIALAVSGIAGPDGGSKDKPVGTVYIGCTVKNSTTSTIVQHHIFKGDREAIRGATIKAAIELAIELLS